MRRARPLVLAFCAMVATQACAEPQADCAPGPEARAGVTASVDKALELTLDDGLRLRLFGVEPPDEGAPGSAAAANARVKLEGWLAAQRIAYEAVGPTPDRWGRMSAFVALRQATPGAAPTLAVAPALVDAGLARARAEPGAGACLTRLLALEAAARAERRGLWGDPAFAVVPAEDRAALGARAGALTIVEGVVASVGRTAGRAYLNFGPIRSVDFAATISTKTARAFEAAGVAPQALEGARLRVRGLLDARFGPQIELFDPAALEIVVRRGVSPQSGPLARQ